MRRTAGACGIKLVNSVPGACSIFRRAVPDYFYFRSRTKKNRPSALQGQNITTKTQKGTSRTLTKPGTMRAASCGCASLLFPGSGREVTSGLSLNGLFQLARYITVTGKAPTTGKLLRWGLPVTFPDAPCNPQARPQEPQWDTLRRLHRCRCRCPYLAFELSTFSFASDGEGAGLVPHRACFFHRRAQT